MVHETCTKWTKLSYMERAMIILEKVVEISTIISLFVASREANGRIDQVREDYRVLEVQLATANEQASIANTRALIATIAAQNATVQLEVLQRDYDRLLADLSLANERVTDVSVMALACVSA